MSRFALMRETPQEASHAQTTCSENDLGMPANPLRPSRHSLRLPDYDYSQPGAYFVTMVTWRREHLLGEIVNGEMRQNEAGKILWEIWQSLPARYPNISLDEAVVMPNHFHGIIVIEKSRVAAIHELPQRDNILSRREEESKRITRRQMIIPLVMGYLKMNSSKRINILLDRAGVSTWQRNYYERIVRDEQAYHAIRQYIRSNPAAWMADKENR